MGGNLLERRFVIGMLRQVSHCGLQVIEGLFQQLMLILHNSGRPFIGIAIFGQNSKEYLLLFLRMQIPGIPQLLLPADPFMNKLFPAHCGLGGKFPNLFHSPAELGMLPAQQLKGRRQTCVWLDAVRCRKSLQP
ncbi:hypothetical protein D3C81_1838140 [compost metagenome]